MAEYYYFSGQAEKAMKKTELYLSAADKEIRLLPAGSLPTPV